MKLYLCEKPSQARDIANVLGHPIHQKTHIKTDNGVVTWAFGHLLELVPPEFYDESLKKWFRETLPILPPKFQLRPKESAIAQFKAIGELLKRCTELVIATDSDREGEMIAREIVEYFGYKGKISRLWLSALDPDSIRKALPKLKSDEETRSLYHAALARSRGDWLVGMNMSRAVTLQSSEKGVSSVGRVQTPTLALVVRRDLAIAEFKPKDYYELLADVISGSNRVSLKFAPREEERIFDRSAGDCLAQRVQGFTAPLAVVHERKKVPPPKPFSLASFQIKANSLWGWSADHSLKIAQSLYETHKFTTYPRSDCEFLPEEQIPDISTILSNLRQLSPFREIELNEPIIRKTVFNTPKVTAHHAIIPTKVAPNMSALSEDEQAAFLLIARHYIATLMPDYEFDQTRISLKFDEKISFATFGNVPAIPGWKNVFGKEIDEEKATLLPDIRNGSSGIVESVTVETKQTKPPARYTEGALIADMKSISKFVTDPNKKARLKETSGIGTEATRASILKTLHDRGFVQTEKKTVVSTDRGRRLIATLEQHLPILIDPGETAVWEDTLEAIASGKQTVEQFTNSLAEQLRSYIETLFAHSPQHQSIGVSYEGREVFDGGTRWIFPGKKGWFSKELFKRPMSAEDYIKIFEAGDPLPKFDGFLSSKGKKFSARLKYNPDKIYNGKPSPGVEPIFE
jgi:DNA topoisomerase-3